jgi:hypothetical protein
MYNVYFFIKYLKLMRFLKISKTIELLLIINFTFYQCYESNAIFKYKLFERK